MKARTLVPVLLVATLGGCVKNDASVEMYGICAFTSTCTFTGTCSAMMLDRPWTAGSELVLMVQFNNQLPNNADATMGMANTNDARVQRYEITYTAAVALPSAAMDVQYTVPAAGSSVLAVWAVPPGTAAAAAISALGSGNVTAHVVASGQYVNGSTFTTGPFDIVFEICGGCLGSCTSGVYCPAPDQSYTCGS
jgi:hypothetical protein